MCADHHRHARSAWVCSARANPRWSSKVMIPPSEPIYSAGLRPRLRAIFRRRWAGRDPQFRPKHPGPCRPIESRWENRVADRQRFAAAQRSLARRSPVRGPARMRVILSGNTDHYTRYSPFVVNRTSRRELAVTAHHPSGLIVTAVFRRTPSPCGAAAGALRR
jgi:hypothetical protein